MRRWRDIGLSQNAAQIEEKGVKWGFEGSRLTFGIHSLEELSLSYNGGKDCLVLLVLLLVSLSNHPAAKSHSPTLPAKLQSVYIISPHPFAEVDSFVNDSVTKYSLNLARYAMPMKEAFKLYLEEYKSVKAILVGTRRTDPHGQTLTHFDSTDKGWPAFMRVHPVIDWHYAEIWAVSTFSHSSPSSLPHGMGADKAVYTTFRDPILFPVRPRIYVTGRNYRHASQPSIKGRSRGYRKDV